jgi:hypothetical protein
MNGEAATLIESSALAEALSGSVWAYPLVNAAHILGVALLVGGSLPLALRLVGLWKSVPAAPLRRVLMSTAGVGFGLAVVCGVLLFITRATEYARSALYASKMAAVGTGFISSLLLNRAAAKQRPQAETEASRLPVRMRLVACLVLISWTSALILGRLVGYF